MMVFRLEPAAAPDDPNWQRATYFGTVIVCADSPADARIVAKDAEAALMRATGAGTPGAIEEAFASAFMDEKLYHVSEDRSGRFSCDEGRKVLAGISDKEVECGPGASSE